MVKAQKVLVVQVAALGHDLVRAFPDMAAELPLDFRPLHPTFPAVTCTAQATFRTASPAADHGMICNGVYNRRLRKVEFWNQSSALVAGERIWQRFRECQNTVGMMFWQQSLGEDVDLVLSPAPIHKHGGGMIQDCYSQPADLYHALRGTLHRPFNLAHYWGPLASKRASRWIADATIEVMSSSVLVTPDLLFTYLPHLDYVLQKKGPGDRPACKRAFQELMAQVARLYQAANQHGFKILVWGDYAITPANQAAFPNWALRQAGLLKMRVVKQMAYPDLHASRAFAVVDHQVAHVFVRHPEDVAVVRACLEHLPGVADVADRRQTLNHPGAGELILTAEKGTWFAYPWWETRREAPDYATHVDIHNKIGFDPCELFFGRLLPPQVSLDTSKIKGTHGRSDAPAAFATDIPFAESPEDLIDLARGLKQYLAHR